MATRTTGTPARTPGKPGSGRRAGERTLATLGGLAAAGTLFAVLLVLVRTNWAPLARLDHGLAADFNDAANDSAAFLSVLRAVTDLGGPSLMAALIVLATAFMLVRRQPRLAAYVAVTGVGALILDPSLKLLVGRLRPVVEQPVAFGGGNSFPSGHALGSIVCYGALLLVFLPSVPRRWRGLFVGVIGTVVALVGFSRIALGVHFLSDVVGAWALGIAWLGATAYAFEVWRRETGRRVTAPMREGLEPEAAGELEPAPDHSPTRAATAGRVAGMILVGWVLTFGLLVGVGRVVTGTGAGNLIGDTAVPRWFEAHRTEGWTEFSRLWSDWGNTHWIMNIAIVAGVLLLALTRHWRTVLFLVLALVGEVSLFLAASGVTGRDRPQVRHLEAHLPTSSFPSGHVAATICLYATVALFAITRLRGGWRYLFLIPAVAMPVLVALSRMYRGMHHPTDVLGSVLLATGWLLTLWLALRPNGRLPGRDFPVARGGKGDAGPGLPPARTATGAVPARAGDAPVPGERTTVRAG